MKKEKTKIEYVAVATQDYIDCYGEKAVKKGERAIIKKPNFEKYKETGKVYFTKKTPYYYGFATYFIPAKLIKVTTKTTIETTEEEV